MLKNTGWYAGQYGENYIAPGKPLEEGVLGTMDTKHKTIIKTITYERLVTFLQLRYDVKYA